MMMIIEYMMMILIYTYDDDYRMYDDDDEVICLVMPTCQPVQVARPRSMMMMATMQTMSNISMEI